ncbi:MAG: alpha/beta hydrolase [Anaerolineaceae bacterium]|nr:alpha/beta hydrolase [Anaerolineaceae bacterium]
MSSVTSKDGTKIAFDKVGSGPAVIFVNGAISYRRAFDPTLEQLAELLGQQFTVYNYDRRGRGESGDTPPFTKEREIEDIQALVEEAGGEAMLFGVSSGAAVALETAATTPAITKLFLYEIPFIVDDGRSPVAPDYVEHLNKLVADDRRDEAVAYFLTEAAGIPPEYAAGAKQDPSWPRMVGVAHTIAYDGSFVAEFMQGKPLPTDRWANVTIPVLVAAGGDSDAWMHNGADALARVLPNASRTTLPGQTHQVDPHVLAPVMIEFFKQ